MLRTLLQPLLFVIAVAYFYVPAVEAASPEIKSLKTYSRITIPSIAVSTFRIKKNPKNRNELILTVENDHTGHLKKGKGLRDKRIDSVTFSKNKENSYQAKIKLTHTNSDYFAYFQPVPPAVIIDVWHKDGARKVAGNRKSRSKTGKKSVKRRPAAQEKSRRKQSNYARPLEFSQNFFQYYEPPVLDFSYEGEKFSTTKVIEPDSGWKWTIPPKDAPEYNHIALAHKMFGKKLYGLAIKTIDMTKRDHPDLGYLMELRLLRAVIYRKLAKQKHDPMYATKAKQILEELKVATDKNGQSLPFSPNVRLFFAAENYRSKNWFAAIEELEFIINAENFRKSPDFPGLIMATARAYFAIKDYPRAERLLEFAYKKYNDRAIGREAGFRLANLLFWSKKYERAEELYRKLLARYPKKLEQHPETFWSLGEISFRRKKVKQARSHYNEYIKRHPTHALASVAYVRLGEIEELLDGNLHQAKFYYTKSINKFPFGKSVRVAKIRLARLDIDNEYDPEFQMKILKSVMENLSNPAAERAMAMRTYIDYLMKDERYSEAIRLSQKGIATSDTFGLSIFKQQYNRSLFAQAEKLAEEGRNSEFLAHYSRYQKWLDGHDNKINKMLSDVFRQMGLYKSSNFYLSRYLNVASTTRKVASEAVSKELSMAQNLYRQGDCRKALGYLANISRSARSMAIQAICKNKVGNRSDAYQLAKLTLPRVQKSDDFDAEEQDHYFAELSEVIYQYHMDRKEYTAARRTVEAANKELKNQNERFMYAMADVLWYQKEHIKAIQSYNQAIKQFPESLRKERSMYNLAMSYLAIGDKKAAVNTLTELKQSSQNIWATSARHELELIEWEEKYSLVLKALPPEGLGL